MKPEPPTLRHLRGYEWVNEYELVDWYTSIGKGHTHTHRNLVIGS